MMSCHGRRVRGCISRTQSETLFDGPALYDRLFRIVYEMGDCVSSLGPHQTYVANIIWFLLEFCQLLWADDGHFDLKGVKNPAVCDVKERD